MLFSESTCHRVNYVALGGTLTISKYIIGKEDQKCIPNRAGVKVDIYNEICCDFMELLFFWKKNYKFEYAENKKTSFMDKENKVHFQRKKNVTWKFLVSLWDTRSTLAWPCLV